MGMFSWIKSDSQEPVYATGQRDKFLDTTGKMLDDKGNEWIEYEYEGYGVFGGKDYFILLAEMNGMNQKDHSDNDLRQLGIELAFSTDELGENSEGVKYPKIVEIHCKKNWEDLPNNQQDPNQGWFFDEEDDDEFE